MQDTEKKEKVMIGLEVHAYLNTKSKLFCSCSTDIADKEPNSVTCPVCISHPGSKPVLNEKAVELAIKIGYALNCEINKNFFFSRKTYFYPDMSANYQITQYEVPVCGKGSLKLNDGKKIGITRAHLEADPAALMHPDGMGKSSHVLIDYNRSGSPLIEMVTDPDLTSPKEARDFLKTLENILSYLKVLKPNTTMKVDCNISINGGNRVEIKNVSGFAAAEKALNFELLRQKRELRMKKKIEQHTRIFNSDTGTTIEARKKETEEDYGYIFDPDLVSVSVEAGELQRIKEDMPELPQQKALRFQKSHGVNEYDATVLCSQLELGNLFEKLVDKYADPTITSKLLTRELLAVLNHDSLELNDVELDVNKLFDLITLMKEGKVSDKNVKQAMINYISGDKVSPKEFLEKNNMLISETIDLNEVVAKIFEANPNAIEEYKNGNEKVMNFLAGLIMRETKGTVDPKKVQELLKLKLER
jgi:aspartyl-tRNA(Asn)/glutamyl-tRNA(Gln) amidotransferase subunit B